VEPSSLAESEEDQTDDDEGLLDENGDLKIFAEPDE
jgi:hypothetical protein